MELKCLTCLQNGKIKTDKRERKIVTCYHYGMPIVMTEGENCGGYVSNGGKE